MKKKDEKFEKNPAKGIRNASYLFIGLGTLMLPFARSGFFLITSVLCLSLGIGGWWYYMQGRGRLSKADFENIVLVTAGRNRGVLTPAILALEAHITIEEAIDRLDQMVHLGICRSEINATGQVEYIFPDFLENPQKR